MFHDRLNEYITQLGCSGRELAEASGLSPATVSRYRSGERRPESEAERAKLVSGIAITGKTCHKYGMAASRVTE